MFNPLPLPIPQKWHNFPSNLPQSVLGQNVNREGFNFKLAVVKTCPIWSLMNNMPFKKSKCLSDPYMTYGKDQKMKIWILFLPWSKWIHSNLRGSGIIVPLNKNWTWSTNKPHGHVLSPKWLFLVKNGNSFTFGCWWVHKTLKTFH